MNLKRLFFYTKFTDEDFNYQNIKIRKSKSIKLSYILKCIYVAFEKGSLSILVDRKFISIKVL